VLLRRGRNSALGKGGTRDGEGVAWAEKPTTDDAGSEGSEVEAAPTSQDANDSLRMSVSDAGAGADGDTGAETCLGTVDDVWQTSGAAHATAISCWMLFSVE
jgi:hypothetical protein